MNVSVFSLRLEDSEAGSLKYHSINVDIKN